MLHRCEYTKSLPDCTCIVQGTEQHSIQRANLHAVAEILVGVFDKLALSIEHQQQGAHLTDKEETWSGNLNSEGPEQI